MAAAAKEEKEKQKKHNTLVVRYPLVYWLSPHFAKPLPEGWHVHLGSVPGSDVDFDPATHPGVRWQHAKVEEDGRVRIGLSVRRSYVVHVAPEEVSRDDLDRGIAACKAVITGLAAAPPSPILFVPVQPPEATPHGIVIARQEEFSPAQLSGDPNASDTPEHFKLGTTANRLLNGWAASGLLEGGVMIDKAINETRRKPCTEWDVQLPGQRQGPLSSHHWHFVVAREPLSPASLKSALAAGQAAALDLGEIIALAGDYYETFEDLAKGPDRAAKSLMEGYRQSDALALMVLDAALFPQLEKDSSEQDKQRMADRLGAISYHVDVARGRKGDAAKSSRESLAAILPAEEIRTIVDAVLEIGARSHFAELHALAQVLLGCRQGDIYSFEEMRHLLTGWKQGAEQIEGLARRRTSADAVGRGLQNLVRTGFNKEILSVVLTNGRYAKLALDNTSHFSNTGEVPKGAEPKQTNWERFEACFRAACDCIQRRMESHGTRRPTIPAEAVARLGFGLHFLTDAFSAGHMRVPRQALGAQRAFAALLMHNFDGKNGLWVHDGSGEPWVAYGDEMLDDSLNHRNKEKTREAVHAALIALKEVAEQGFRELQAGNGFSPEAARKLADLKITRSFTGLRPVVLPANRLDYPAQDDRCNIEPLYRMDGTINRGVGYKVSTFPPVGAVKGRAGWVLGYRGFELIYEDRQRGTRRLDLTKEYNLARFTRAVSGWQEPEIGLDELVRAL